MRQNFRIPRWRAAEPPPFPELRSGWQVMTVFDGDRLRLDLDRQNGRLVGRFNSDGALEFRAAPVGPAAVPAADDPAPWAPAVAALAPDDRPSVRFGRRTTLLDERGVEQRVLWDVLPPEQFARETSGPVPRAAVGRPRVPYGRWDEYFDGQGRPCRTVWSVRDLAGEGSDG